MVAGGIPHALARRHQPQATTGQVDETGLNRRFSPAVRRDPPPDDAVGAAAGVRIVDRRTRRVVTIQLARTRQGQVAQMGLTGQQIQFLQPKH